MKQFLADLGWVLKDLLESIGDLIVYNCMAVKWVFEDLRDAVIETWEAIRNGELRDDETTRHDD